MDSIHEPNSDFKFDNLILSPPISSSSGNHFIKYSVNGNPLYIQTPKCKIKQGIMKAGKKLYCDLMFSIADEELTQWLENLENNSQKYIYEKREKWFETTLEKHDIENSFTSLVKLIKSGKCYTLRANIPMVLGKMSLKIYDESEQLLTLEDLKEDTQVVSILEIQGIKCSPRGFQIEIEIKQLLVLKPPDIFQKCILIPAAMKNKSNLEELKGHSINHISGNEIDNIVMSNHTSSDKLKISTNITIDSTEHKSELNQDEDKTDILSDDLDESPNVDTDTIPSSKNDVYSNIEENTEMDGSPESTEYALNEKKNEPIYENQNAQILGAGKNQGKTIYRRMQPTANSGNQ